MKFVPTKSVLLAGLAVAMLSAPAQAAQNMDSPYGEPQQDCGCGQWGGLYAGGHIGGTWGDFKYNPANAGPGGTGGNIMGGGQLGYNVQFSQFVIGAEFDFSFIDIDASTAGAGSFEEDMQYTLRGRFGYALGRYLPYATVGVGFTTSESKLAGTAATGDSTHVGIAAGAGVDIALKDNWSTRLEYLYVDAPKETSTLGGTAVTGGSDNHTLRVGFNYRFQL
ncbi:MAG: outer membrane beta-barrel protein [Alphaproteobacteria bacterium]|nr:outer membrane beta-barrel protein [Alphaproteobacteria bacterium]